MKSRLSLGVILTFSLAALAALPILGIGLVTQHVVSRDLTARITNQNLMLVRTLAAEVRQFLDRPLLLLEEIRDNVTRLRLVNRKKVDFYLASVMRHHQGLFNMIVMLDHRGLVSHIVPFNQDYIGVNWSRHTVFHRPDGRVKAYWSSTFISPRTGQPTLTISIPWARGMLVGYLNLAVLKTITGRIDLGKGSYVAIADRRGTAIAYPGWTAVQQQVNLKDIEVIRRGLAGQEGALRFDFRGRSFLGSVAVVRRTGWAVAVIQPAAEAFAMVSRMNKVVWLGILISLAVALAVGTWTLRQVQGPLSRLVTSSGRIASGDYDFTPPRPGFREIDNLVRAFEAMSVAVKDREAALRDSEKRYRDLVSSASEGIVVAQDGLIRFANPAFSHIIGYSTEELVGRPVIGFIHPDDRQMLMDRHEQRLQGELPPSVYFFKALAKDGQVKWLQINAVGITWEGKPATLNLLTDITERRRAEEALKKSEEQYRTLIENMNEVLYTVDTEGRLTFVSLSVEALTGYTVSEVLGQPFTRFIHPDHLPMLAENFRDVLAGQPKGSEFRLIKKDGQTVWVQSSSHCQENNGRVVGLQGIIADVTERRRAEEALRESEERYREIFQSSPDAITISDLSTGLFLDVNEGFCQLSGFTREEAIGRTVFDLDIFIDLGDRDGYLKILNEQGRIDGYEIKLRARDGTVQYGLLSARPLRYGGRDCLAVVVRDISPLKRAQQEKARLEAQLQQAQKMEAVGTLAGGVAHDFNNILQAISGYVEVMAAREDQAPRAGDSLTQISKAVERATDLVRRLLTFSRKVEPQLRPVDLNAEVLQAVKILERTIPKMIEIETSLDPDLKMINGDANQLEQVLLNLGVNAGDAMPQGGRLIIETKNTVLDEKYCRRHPGILPGEYVHLSFSDTGHGMDEETQRFIFDPFYTTKEIGRGTGLGLAVVYGIVKNHGGAVTCSSQLDQGTRFNISLPAADKQATRSTAALPVREEVRGGTETILVVDDEQGVRETVRDMLLQFGYQTLLAASGEQALEVFQQASPKVNLVILDLGMPGMGGHRCLEELRALDPELRIIIASGYGVPEQEKKVLAAGAVRFLAKPYHLSEMLQTVRQVLDR